MVAVAAATAAALAVAASAVAIMALAAALAATIMDSGSGFRVGDHGFADRGLGDRGFGRGYRGYDGYGGGWWDGWGPDYYYPYYDGDYTAYDDANVASCEARYHSYDPATGTYDGHRHYCVA